MSTKKTETAPVQEAKKEKKENIQARMELGKIEIMKVVEIGRASCRERV